MTHDFSSWIGRSITREDTATPRLIAEYRATMAPFIFEPSDPSHCAPGLHWGLAPATPGYDGCAPDGSEARGTFLPPIPLPRRRKSSFGGRCRFLERLFAGRIPAKLRRRHACGLREARPARNMIGIDLSGPGPAGSGIEARSV